MSNVIVIKKEAHVDITISRSLFRGESFICADPQEVKPILERLRAATPDANHHCWAYRIGMKGEHTRYSDDGEPHGTAGPPILDVLVKKDITNTLIVVTRWFGGVKLGTGGLVRAYSDAAKSVLELSEPGELIETCIFECTISYSAMNPFENGLAALNATITERSFTDHVYCITHVPRENSEAFRSFFADCTAGKGVVNLKETMFL